MGKPHSIVNQARLHELYDYDPTTGIFFSKTHGVTLKQKHKGYLVVELWHYGKEKRFRLHTLAWVYYYGRWPHPMIDHINRIKTDNRICNLREVTVKQNCENRSFGYSKSELPKSGFKGVHWIKASNKWKASIGHDRKVICLGLFDDPAIAFSKYKEAAEKLHTHNSVITAKV